MRRLAVIVPLFLFIFLFGTSRYHLWKPDEPRYAEVSREMMESKSFVVPVLNGRSYYDKPPGFFILTGLSYRVFGRVNEFSARFTSAFFSVLSLVVLSILGGIMFGKAEAFLGSIVLGTSLEYVWIARRVNMDNVLTFFILSSLLSFYAWYRKGDGRFLFPFYLLMGLGMLVKGPLALFIPLSTAVIFLFVRSRKHLVEVGLKWGIPLAFFPVFLWLFWGALREGLDYPKTVLGMHVLGMYFKGWSHPRPFYYYFINFPLGFTPWTFFLPASLWIFFREKLWRDEKVLFFTIWFVFTFVFLSFSRAKRELYLLPAYPAASMVVSSSLLRAKDFDYRKVFLPFSMFVTVFSFFLLYYRKIDLASSVKAPLFLMFFVMGILFLIVSRRKDVSLFLASSLMVVFVATSVFAFSLWVFPEVDRFKYPKEVMDVLKEESLPVYLYRYRNAQFNFYLRRNRIPILSCERDLKRLVVSEKPFFLVVRKKHITFSTKPFQLVASSPTWGGRVLLLRFSGKGGIDLSKRKGV